MLIFMLTGCGAGATKTMSCSYQTKYNNINTKTSYDVDYEDTEVKKVRITYQPSGRQVCCKFHCLHPNQFQHPESQFFF